MILDAGSAISFGLGDILNAIQQGGFVGLLGLIIVGGARKWWVFGWQLKDTETREAEWKSMALRGVEANERALELAQRIHDRYAPDASPAPRHPDSPPRRPRDRQ